MSKPSEVVIRNFQAEDAEQAIALWRSTQWTSVSATDSPPAIKRFLEGNAGLSWVAEHAESIVGTVMCGQDYRRGYIYHLVVDESHYGCGIGGQLLDRALESLREIGIIKCHAVVIDGNPSADYFWARRGWERQSTSQYSLLL